MPKDDIYLQDDIYGSSSIVLFVYCAMCSKILLHEYYERENKKKPFKCKQIIFEYKGLAYLITFEERELNRKDFIQRWLSGVALFLGKR